MKSETPPRFCSHCGHVLPESARFCPACGVGIDTTGSHTPTPLKTKSSKDWVPGALLIVVGIIALPLGYAAFHEGQTAFRVASIIGWQFVSISQNQASIDELAGGAGIVIGLVLFIVGVVLLAKRL